jgi:alkane 1-monooxygenase
MSILTKTSPEGIAVRARLRSGLPPWWLGYALSLFFPACLLVFLGTGPHGPAGALAWTCPMWAVIALDRFGPAERRTVPDAAPAWFFDGLLYLLVLLQVSNVLALGLMVSRLGWSSGSDILASLANLLAVRLMAGPNACCAAICPAHELIHRRGRWRKLLGRLLLASVCYDHFFVAHKRAHHAHLGSAQDPSTARLGESFDAFFRRTVVQQWRVAWRAGRRSVLAGMAAEAGWLVWYGWLFGPLAVLVFLNQSYHGVRVLEAVNYFQHYGLTEERPGVACPAAWRNDSAVSLFLFLGLTRHADHHRRPGVPYPQLRALAEGPEMPRGYLWMAMMVLRRDAAYRREAELRFAGDSADSQGGAP